MGILTALAGIALESRLMVWMAIGLLGLSILLRVILRIRERRAQSPPPDE